MSEGEEIPIIFRASSVEREDWNDHTYLQHIGDGLVHIWQIVKPENKARGQTAGTVLGIALSVMVLILMAVGGVPR